MNTPEKFEGGVRLWRVSRLSALLGLVLTGVGYFLMPQQAAFSYLLAFTYWTGIAMAALILLAIFHASGARWMVVLRRALEVMASAVLPLSVLFVPVALSVGYLYVWVTPSAGLSEHAKHLIEHKHAWLNVPGFLVRSAVYLIVFCVVSVLLLRWSAEQDDSKEALLTLKLRRWATGALPFLGLAMTFAAFDWLMSLDPTWFSTLFGVYYFAGSLVAAIALLTLAAVYARGANLFGELVGRPHFHNLGKLLLAFTSFWAYIAFSQFLLIWSANIPEEVTWYVVRTRTSWSGWAWLLLVAHFVLPFLALLSRRLKERPRLLALVAMWLLLAHFLDLYWLVMPTLHQKAPQPHPLDILAFLGVGGAAVSFVVWTLRGRFTVPVGDPYLLESLRYSPP